MQAATKLGISITIGKVGSNLPTTGTRATVSSVDRPDEWQPATLDEDSLLHQLRATLVQALDASTRRSYFACHLLNFCLLNNCFYAHFRGFHTNVHPLQQSYL